MRGRGGVVRSAGRRLAAGRLAAVAGRGDDPNDTTIIIGATPTPGAGSRTATPVRSPDVTPTPGAAPSTPTAVSATSTATTGTPGTTATAADATPTAGGT